MSATPLGAFIATPLASTLAWSPWGFVAQINMIVWFEDDSWWLETFQETCCNLRTEKLEEVVILLIPRLSAVGTSSTSTPYRCLWTAYLWMFFQRRISRNEWKWHATVSPGSCNSNASNCHISHLMAKFISLTSFLMAFLQQAMATGRLIRNPKFAVVLPLQRTCRCSFRGGDHDLFRSGCRASIVHGGQHHLDLQAFYRHPPWRGKKTFEIWM